MKCPYTKHPRLKIKAKCVSCSRNIPTERPYHETYGNFCMKCLRLSNQLVATRQSISCISKFLDNPMNINKPRIKRNQKLHKLENKLQQLIHSAPSYTELDWLNLSTIEEFNSPIV